MKTRSGRAVELTRDSACQALQDLFGYEPEDYDGLTLEEISQQVSVGEWDSVCMYLGVDG